MHEHTDAIKFAWKHITIVGPTRGFVPSVCHNRWIRRLGFTHYDAYIIASTGHAASYDSPNGHLADGTREDLPSSEGQQGMEAYRKKDS